MKCLGIITLWLALSAQVIAGTLQDIAASGELKLAYRADTPPFSYQPPGQEPEGFTIDLCRIIARDIQASLGLAEMKIRWVKVESTDRIDAIVSGRAHLLCGATTITLSRLEKVDFSNLTYATGAALMRWADAKIENLDDLARKRVVTVAGTTTDKVLRETLASRNINAKVITTQNHVEALKLLASKKVHAMAGDRAILLGIGFKSQGENNFVIMEDRLSFEPFALPLRRNDADFRLVVNRSLSSLYLRGDVGRFWTKWFGPYQVRATQMLLTLYRLNSFSE